MTIGSFTPKGDFFSLPGASVSRYVWASQFLRGLKNVLDAGCGHGYGCAYLARDCVESVVGVDVDSFAIAFAKRHYEGAGCKFTIGNLQEQVFPEQDFDACVSFEVIEAVEEPEKFLSVISSTLKPGGFLIISTPNKKHTQRLYEMGIPVIPNHVREFYAEEMFQRLSQHFEHIDFYAQYREKDLEPDAIEQYVRLIKYTHDSPIPKFIRAATPSRIKDAWLSSQGIRRPADSRGRWNDYLFTPANSLTFFDERIPVQVYVARKK